MILSGMKSQRQQEWRVRTVPEEKVKEIIWDPKPRRVASSGEFDVAVTRASSALVRGNVLLVEQREGVDAGVSMNVFLDSVVRVLDSGRVDIMTLEDIQQFGLKEAANSEFLPKFAVRLRPIEI